MESSLAMTGPREPRSSLDLRLVRELPRLRGFVRRLFGRSGASADVDDVLQEVAARAWRYRQSFDGERALGPWLRASALRAFLDHRAKRARAPEALAGEPTAAHSERSEARETLTRLLARLEPIERDVLVRFHARGESVREIAAALALPEGTVKSHLHRARKKLAGVTP